VLVIDAPGLPMPVADIALSGLCARGGAGSAARSAFLEPWNLYLVLGSLEDVLKRHLDVKDNVHALSLRAAKAKYVIPSKTTAPSPTAAKHLLKYVAETAKAHVAEHLVKVRLGAPKCLLASNVPVGVVTL